MDCFPGLVHSLSPILTVHVVCGVTIVTMVMVVIVMQLHGAINGDDVKKLKVEKEVLQVWDRLYEKLSSKV